MTVTQALVRHQNTCTVSGMTTVGYTRLSLDIGGEGLAIARQRQDIDAKALTLWAQPVTEWYEDNDITADPRKKVRPEFQRLLADMAAGRVKRVLCYDQDRLVRDMRELEDIVDAVESGDVALTSVNGDIDLRTDNGRMVARIKGAVAKNELEKIARRTARQKQQRVEAGLPLGQRFRTFGYERDWSVIESEATVVREVFTRLIAGESQNAVTRDLVARGIKTATGGEWTALQTSRMVKTPKYAGLQTYKGSIIGKSTVPALIDEATYYASQNPASKAGFNTRRHLLSGILICDACKAPMNGTAANKRRAGRYRCEARSGGCGAVSIKLDWADGAVATYTTNFVMAEAKGWGPYEKPVEEVVPDTRLDDLDEKIAFFLASEMEPQDVVTKVNALRAERKALVAEQTKAVEVKAQWAQPVIDFEDADLSVKRATIKRYIKHVFIRPGSRSRNYDPARFYVITADNVRHEGTEIDDPAFWTNLLK